MIGVEDAMAANAVIVLGPGEGRVVPRRYGEQTILKATEDETRGAYAVRENLAPEGFGGVPCTSIPPTQPKPKIVIPDGADEIVEQVLTHASPTPRVEDVHAALVEALGKASLDAATGRQDLLPAPQVGTDGTNIGVALAAPDEQSCLLGARIDGKVLVWRPSRVQVQPGELTCGPATALARQGMRAPH
jgi:hypothetical protein